MTKIEIYAFFNMIISVLEIFAPYLSLASVLLALGAIVQAKKQNYALTDLLDKFRLTSDQQSKKVTTLLDFISENLSTRQIGEFPVFCSKIVNIIKQANYSIDIICDVPAYGIFSSPNTWPDYKAELIRKTNEPDVKVRLITLSLNERIKIYNQNPPTNSNELLIALKNNQFRTNLTSFSQRYMNNKPVVVVLT